MEKVRREIHSLVRDLGDHMASAANTRRAFFDRMKKMQSMVGELTQEEREVVAMMALKTFEEFTMTATLMLETAETLMPTISTTAVAEDVEQAVMKTAKGVH